MTYAGELGKLTNTTADDQVCYDEVCKTPQALVGRVDIAPREIKIALALECIAKILQVEPELISEEILSITSEFQYRKRGVETKLILENAAVPRDETSFRNIARAHRYFDMIRKGHTFGETPWLQSSRLWWIV